MHRIFVSYTSGDTEFVKHLLARLNLQENKPWMYGTEEQAIRAGAAIDSECRKQIDACALFVPIVTANSFRSPYTALEVEHAWTRPQLLIIALVERALERAPWPATYQKLREKKYVLVDFASRASLEAAIMDLCAAVDMPYVPVMPSDRRLPFMDRFADEIKNKIPRRTEVEIGIYWRLLNVLNQFTEEFQKKCYPSALRKITYFLFMLEEEYPDHHLLYPYVVQGVCEILCNDLTQAERMFRSLAENPDLQDESVYGGLAVIHQQQGRHLDALACYQKARAIVVAREPLCIDVAATAGIVLNSVHAGVPFDLSLLRELDQAKVPEAEDAQRLQVTRALARASLGQPEAALALLRPLLNTEYVEPALVIHCADLLWQSGATHESMTVLEKFKNSWPDDDVLLHRLASYCAKMQQWERAASYFAKLVQDHPANRQYRIDAARNYLTLRNHSLAWQIVAPMVAPAALPLPLSPEDFYYDGFANWLIGLAERANYDFERSGMPANQMYANLEHLGVIVPVRLDSSEM